MSGSNFHPQRANVLCALLSAEYISQRFACVRLGWTQVQEELVWGRPPTLRYTFLSSNISDIFYWLTDVLLTFIDKNGFPLRRQRWLVRTQPPAANLRLTSDSEFKSDLRPPFCNRVWACPAAKDIWGRKKG